MDDIERCYASAIRILKYRFNSAAELRRKLRAKGFNPQSIEAAVLRLTNEKWLDDRRFADAYVRTRVQRQKGRMRIRRELINAGVDDEIIRRAVGENVDSEAERAQALALAAKRLPILIRRHGRQLARNKLTAYLLNQGYDVALVRSVVKETRVADD
jgi:regulatory protein